MQISLKSFLISVYIWSIIIITMLPLFIGYMVLWLLVFPFDRSNQVTHYYMTWWTRLYLTCNPGWKLHIENRNSIDKSKTYILISNHQSIIDIALLLQLRVNFKWVSKIELARVPFVGWVIWMNNHILVRRGDKKSVVKMAEACNRTLQSGTPVFMFPEGTRGSGEALQPFKEGAFIMAIENSVPILPLVIDGSGEALPHKGFWFKVRQHFTVRVLDEISVETIQNSNLNSLMALTADLMTQGINSIRKQEKEKRILKRHHKLMRRTGYAADSEGIIERYINVGDAWENHLDHCRKFIHRSVGKKKYKNIAVFGSGWLLDVPLDLLANASEEVYLYDVVHPAQVVHKISRYPNVKAITADVTGGVLEAVNEAVNVYKKTGIKPDLASLFERQFRPEKEPDYIISLNILSQLGEIISDYLLENIPMDISPDEISSWLQRAHLQMMKPGKSCMITDIEECLYDVAGQLVKTKKLVFCPMPDGQKETWDWQFDPLGEYNPGMKTVSRVAAVEF